MKLSINKINEIEVISNFIIDENNNKKIFIIKCRTKI